MPAVVDEREDPFNSFTPAAEGETSKPERSGGGGGAVGRSCYLGDEHSSGRVRDLPQARLQGLGFRV
jgi:hypothetical protein